MNPSLVQCRYLLTLAEWLVTDLDDSHRALEPQAAMAASNPFAPARAGFPSAGEFVDYLASSHLAYDLGQLVAWRGAAGLKRAGRPDALAA